MKQVTVLTAIGAPVEIFDDATADLESFEGCTYVSVRRVPKEGGPKGWKEWELVAVFSSFHSFRIDDTQSPAQESIDYLNVLLSNTSKEVVKREQDIEVLNKTIKDQKYTIDLLLERVKELRKQVEEARVDYSPPIIKDEYRGTNLPPSLPVAMEAPAPREWEHAPWPTSPAATNTLIGEQCDIELPQNGLEKVPDMPDEAYAEKPI